MRTKGWIKFPKNLLYNKKYKNLSDKSKYFLLYLMVKTDELRKKEFFLTKDILYSEFDISRTSLWRTLKELEQIDVNYEISQNKYYFYMNNFYHNSF